MPIPKEFELTLNDDTFNTLKADFDGILKKTLFNMQKKDSDVAEIRISLKISFDKEMVPDASVNNMDGQREVVIPKFDHKVSSVLQIKDELSGTLSGKYELEYNKARKNFVMREIISPQTTLDDYM